MQLKGNGYVLTETEENGTLYFYREDGLELGDVDGIAKEFFETYNLHKMFNLENPEMAKTNFKLERSRDDKSIRIKIGNQSIPYSDNTIRIRAIDEN